MKKNKKLLFIFFILTALDQLAKLFAPQGKINSLFTYLCNKNIAWSIPVSAGFFYLAWIAIIAVLALTFFKTKNHNQRIFITLIFSGAVSNLVDRLRIGCVVDYVDLKFFPAFNFADAYITIGVVLIAINFFQNQKNTKY